jgi:hypothetical protein
VTHAALNKDTGQVDPVTGATSAPTKPRGQVLANFYKAVQGAIAETRRQWQDFRAALVAQYGAGPGGLMICALTRDDPVTACQGGTSVAGAGSLGPDQEARPSLPQTAAGTGPVTRAEAASPAWQRGW